MPRSQANKISLMLLAIGIMLGIALFSAVRIADKPPMMTLFIVVCSIALVILIIGFAVLQFSRECPNCEYIFTNKEINKQVASSKTGYRTITRQERNNKTDEKREWEEQIRVKTVQYLHTYQCKNCEHIWHGTSTSQYQDFDD